MLRKSEIPPLKMSSQLIRQTRQSTAAALAWARPQGKIGSEWTPTHQEYLPTTPAEAHQLLSSMKKEALSRVFLNDSSPVSIKIDSEAIEEG